MKVLGWMLVFLGFVIVLTPRIFPFQGDLALFFAQPFIASMFVIGGLIFIIGGFMILAIKQFTKTP